MTNVMVNADCGNSPKNIFVKDLAIAFARRDTNFILGSTTDDILWNRIGQKPVQGKSDFARALEQIKNDPVEELTIHHVVTHGKAGAVNGLLRSQDGKRRAFCEVYEFSNAKGSSVREITSYVLEIS